VQAVALVEFQDLQEQVALAVLVVLLQVLLQVRLLAL
jgi:hypothetical protein